MAKLGDNDRMLLGGCVPDISPATALDAGLSYEETLQWAVRECKLLKDYERARFVWTLLADMAQRLGTPYALIRKYHEELIKHFEHRGEQDNLSADFSEKLAKAVKSCAGYFWANSSWAVLFCVCRDRLAYKGSMADFERLIGGIPLNRPLPYPCPEGTIQKTISNHSYMKKHITKWQQEGAKERVLLLAKRLEEQLKPQP